MTLTSLSEEILVRWDDVILFKNDMFNNCHQFFSLQQNLRADSIQDLSHDMSMSPGRLGSPGNAHNHFDTYYTVDYFKFWKSKKILSMWNCLEGGYIIRKPLTGMYISRGVYLIMAYVLIHCISIKNPDFVFVEIKWCITLYLNICNPMHLCFCVPVISRRRLATSFVSLCDNWANFVFGNFFFWLRKYMY